MTHSELMVEYYKCDSLWLAHYVKRLGGLIDRWQDFWPDRLDVNLELCNLHDDLIELMTPGQLVLLDNA